MLDRNGLRPGRWMITRDGWVCLGSESGIFTTTPNKIARMGRLQPAQLFVVDLETGLVRTDGEPELAVASSAPYGDWYAEGKLGVRELPDPMATIQPVEPLLQRQLAFGYTQEDLRTLLAPLLRDGREPTGSMGNDAALPVFSDHSPSLFSYFKQRFAQVTNPAIDSVREQCVMSLRTDIGPQGNLLSDQPQIVNHVELAQPILTDFELERLRRNPHNALHSTTIDTTWALDGRRGRPRGRARADPLAGRRGARGGHDPARPQRPGNECRAGTDPGAARLLDRPSRADPARHPAPGRARRRVRGAARGPPSRGADRLRRDGDQPVPDARDDDDARRSDRRPRRPARRCQRDRDRGDQQGPAQGPLEDRDRDDPLLPRRADLRDRRDRSEGRRRPLHRHPLAARRDRPRRDRPRGPRPPCPRLPRGPRDGAARARRARPPRRRQREAAAAGRRLPLAARRRDAHVGPGDDRLSAARGPLRGRHRQPRVLRGLQPSRQRRELEPGHDPRPARARGVGRAGAARRGRAGKRDRQAVLDRGDEPRRALAGGPRDARDRDEPSRRLVEQRRGRRGPPPQHPRPERRRAPLADPPGRIGPLRRRRRVPLPRRPDPDQDRPGREAGRGRSASRPQGRHLHRRAPLRAAGHRADLAAAAPRHLLDRGPQAAHLRPPGGEPDGQRVRQARGRVRLRHRRRRLRQGRRRPRRHRRPRRRHRRLAAVVDPGRRRALGDRDRRDSAGAARQRPADPGRRCRPTVRCGPAATSSSGRCSAPTRSASRPPR